MIQLALGSLKGNDFTGQNMAVLAGEQAAMAAMPEIERKLKAMQSR